MQSRMRPSRSASWQGTNEEHGVNERVDVCVLGGGIAGASVAYALAPYASVVVLEREAQVGYHSTGRSAAVYSPQYGSLAIRRLTAASGPFLKAPPEGFATAPLLTPRGFLTLGRSDEREAYEATRAEAAATGQLLEALTETEVRRRIPFLKPGAAAWALLDATAMDMDVEAMLQGFLRGARSHGARVVTGVEITALECGSEGWRIATPSGDWYAGTVVNAAGAWADDVARLAGVAPIGVVPHRRTAFVCDVPAGVDLAQCPMTMWADEQFYFKPEAGRLLGSLAEENPTTPGDPQPEDLDVAIAVDRIEQVVDFEIRKLVRAWTGLRSFVADRDPVSGFDARVPGFYWHAALGGYGIQTAPALGAHAANRILDRPMDARLQDLGLESHALDPARLAP
jgi:D-arginine dehydrogenase